MSGENPFGRSEDERTDAFGNPIRPQGAEEGRAGEEGRSGIVPDWDPPEGAAPAPKEHPTAPPAHERHGGFLPPTDAPQESGAWWSDPEQARPPQGPSGAYPGPVTTATSAGETADWGMRALAAVVDFLIRAAIAGVFAALGAAFSSGSEDGIVVGGLIGLGIGIFVYAPVLLARWNGQTVGHRVTATRIVMTNGDRMSGGRGFTREVLVKNFLSEGVGQFTFFILPLLNYLWPLWDARDEALHDKICNTRVVRAS